MQARNSHHHHKTREHASKQCNHIQRRFFRSSIFLYLYLVNRKFGSIFEKEGKREMNYIWNWYEDEMSVQITTVPGHHTNGA